MRASFCSSQRRVVALERDAAPAIELEDPLRHVVEEVPVVGDRDDGARVLLEEAFEPVDRLGVEVVGRLVEEQQVGVAEEQPGERDATLLATGQGRDVGVVGRAAQGVHRDVDVALEVPGIGRGDPVLERGLPGADRLVVGVGVGPGGHDRVVLVDQGLDLGHAVEHVALDVLGRVELGLLAEIADREAGRQPRLAHEPVIEPGHDPQQGRLAGAVGPDDADLGARVERQRDVLEDGAVGRVVPGEPVRAVDEFGGHAVRVEPSAADGRLRRRHGVERAQHELMPDAARDDHDRLTRCRDMATRRVADAESVAPEIPHPDVRRVRLLGGDPGDHSAARCADEGDPEAGAVPEVGGVDDVDDGDDVAAPAPFAVQRKRDGDEAEGQDNPTIPRIGASRPLHSSRPPHGLTALEIGEASLAPMALSAKARQTYSTPLVRLAISAVGSATDFTARVTGHVLPLSLEHSYRKPDTAAGSAGGTLIWTALSSASTEGFAGTAGRPIGVAVVPAGTHGPCDVAPTAATSHW